MNARISYKLARCPHPWNAALRDQVDIWCLIKVITPEYGSITEEPVAIFNLDSEALLFQGVILSEGVERSIAIDAPTRKLLEASHRHVHREK
jgi:hypothetical protein